jgi:hypothetical protein
MDQSPRWLWRTAITVAGGVGFVGLLVSSHYFPSAADSLRVFAIIWFFGFGAAKFALDLKIDNQKIERSRDGR